MNPHIVSALLEVAALFGLPLLAVAGGFGLRRRFKEREPRYAFHAGTVLAAVGGVVLLWIFALIAMMRNW